MSNQEKRKPHAAYRKKYLALKPAQLIGIAAAECSAVAIVILCLAL